MIQAEKILTGVLDLPNSDWLNDATILNRKEALEAMKHIAWGAFKHMNSLNNPEFLELALKSEFEDWRNKQL